MTPVTTTHSIAEAAVVYFCGVLFYLAHLILITLRQSNKKYHYAQGAVAVVFFIASTVLIIWFGLARSRNHAHTFPFMLWKGSMAACFTTTEIVTLYNASVNSAKPRIVAHSSVIATLLYASVSLWLWFTVQSDALWAVFSMTHSCYLAILIWPIQYRLCLKSAELESYCPPAFKSLWRNIGVMTVVTSGSLITGGYSFAREIRYHFGIQCGFAIIANLSTLLKKFRDRRPKEAQKPQESFSMIRHAAPTEELGQDLTDLSE